MKKIFLFLTLTLLLTNLFAQEKWYPVYGGGSEKTPTEKMSLLAEIFVVHDHFDEDSHVGWAEGVMVNRHIWKGRYIDPPKLITRDSKGENEDPKAAYVSLAAQPATENGLGGELYDPNDSRTPHQVDWDFLEDHVEKAYKMYIERRASDKEYLNNIDKSDVKILTDWEKVKALCDYSLQWKMKEPEVYPGFHPVDVLNHSSYCSGVANILHGLAMVAGYETRTINITNHSMVEVNINGKWYWYDNHTFLNAYSMGVNNYAELTEDPESFPYLTPKQKEYLSVRAARYRSPYFYAGRFYWHFCWGENDDVQAARNDITDGFGLTVPYDPSTATALYPQMKRHAFLVPKTWPPAVNLSEKGSFIRAAVPLEKGMSVRKRFNITDSPDNPIKGGKIKLWYDGDASGDEIECLVDGAKLKFLGKGVHFKQNTLEFEITKEMLTAGEHDLVINVVGKEITLLFYPDIVEPYFPVASKEINIPDKAFSVDPYISVKDLEELVEEF